MVQRLTTRREFLDVQKGRRISSGLFVVQALPRAGQSQARVGYTVSKKVSPKAVVRNRIRRRLKAMAADHSALLQGLPYDLVLVARLAALTAPFAALSADLSSALRRLDMPRPAPVSSL